MPKKFWLLQLNKDKFCKEALQYNNQVMEWWPNGNECWWNFYFIQVPTLLTGEKQNRDWVQLIHNAFIISFHNLTRNDTAYWWVVKFVQVTINVSAPEFADPITDWPEREYEMGSTEWWSQYEHMYRWSEWWLMTVNTVYTHARTHTPASLHVTEESQIMTYRGTSDSWCTTEICQVNGTKITTRYSLNFLIDIP